MATSRSISTSKPWSPVGYKVVLVSDEIVPTPPRPRSPKPPLLKALQRRTSRVPMVAIAAGGFLMLILVATVFSLFQATVEGGGRHGLFVQGNMPEAAIPQDFQVAIPAAIVNDPPAEEKAGDIAPEILRPNVDPGANAERENFGTEVQFVRNPQEAGRLAKEQRKLTFLLHVSGNFENRAFT